MKRVRQRSDREGESLAEVQCAILMQALPSRCSFLLRTLMYFSSKHKLDFSPPDVDSNADTCSLHKSRGLLSPCVMDRLWLHEETQDPKRARVRGGGPMGIKETAPVFSLGAVSSAVWRSPGSHCQEPSLWPIDFWPARLALEAYSPFLFLIISFLTFIICFLQPVYADYLTCVRLSLGPGCSVENKKIKCLPLWICNIRSEQT